MAFILTVGNVAFGASLSLYGGGLNSHSDAYANNGSSVADPLAQIDWSQTDAYSFVDAWVKNNNQARGLGEGIGYAGPPYYDTGYDLEIFISAYIVATLDDSNGQVSANADVKTADAAGVPGIFFEITTSPGEGIGNPVRVDFLWSPYEETMLGGSGTISGCDTGDLGITVTDYSTTDPPVWVWSHEAISIGENDIAS